MEKKYKVSIVVPCKEIDSMTKKCIEECLKLNYLNFEILVLPDDADEEILKEFPEDKIKIIKTGKVKPAFKRNIGMKEAEGDFFAFIDSDAYPREDWLNNAVKYFEDEKIGIVGGPNLTPQNAGFWEKFSGYALSNYLTSGAACIRYKIGKNQFVKELPSCNYISRKEISPEYDSSFLTAEDSKFCFDVLKKRYKILYAKEVVVYHHRRKSLKEHLKQVSIYGRDIAWLTKKEFSFDKLYYSQLSFFVIVFIGGVIFSPFNQIFRTVFSFFFLIYLLLMFFTSMHENIKTTFYVFLTTISTHFAYGIGWLYGFISKKK